MHRISSVPAFEGMFGHLYPTCNIVMTDVQQWIAFGVCEWATTSLLQCTAFNLAGGLVCRVFIGVFEGLFGTGIVYYLSLVSSY